MSEMPRSPVNRHHLETLESNSFCMNGGGSTSATTTDELSTSETTTKSSSSSSSSSLSKEKLSLISSIPKVELHLHIEGTLEPELVFALAEKNQIPLPYETATALRAAYRFENLSSFLDLYYAGTAVLMTENDFYVMTKSYLDKSRSQNVVHAEIFFDPQSHTSRGVAFDTIVSGITRALNDVKEAYGMTSYLVMCFLRHLSEDDAMATLERALDYKHLIHGVGLDSSERGNPPIKFANVFARAREEGWRVMAHAGEEGPASYIRDALDVLKVERVDHGVRCLDDEVLVKRLVEERVPLTVCPLSNVKLCVFESMKEHNLKLLMDKNLLVTINSDDPAYFGGYIEENYVAVAEDLDLSNEDILVLAHNGVEASFMDDDRKTLLHDRIDDIAKSLLSRGS